MVILKFIFIVLLITTFVACFISFTLLLDMIHDDAHKDSDDYVNTSNNNES